MKLIILDHFRRWWWAWAVGAIAYGAEMVGICTISSPNHDFNSFFPLGFFLGAFLLSMDLQRGHTRALLALPLSLRQIARAWWWVAVGLPVLIFAVLSALVMGTILLLGACGQAVPPVQFENGILYWLVNALLFGTMFFALTGMSTKTTGRLEWGNQAGKFFFGGLWGGAILIWLFLKDFHSYEGWGVLIFSIALSLSILSWFRAERLVQNRGGLATSSGPAGRVTNSSRCAEGSGGLLFLVRVIFLRMVGTGLLCYVGFAFILRFIEIGDPRPIKISFPINTVQFLWIICFQLNSLTTHIRFLRTLPVSATRVAGILVLTTLTAMASAIYVANLVMAALYHSVPLSPLEMVHQGCLLEIATTLFFIPVFVRHGMTAITTILGIIVMVSAMLGMSYVTPYLSNPANIAISMFFILGSWIATKFILERCSSTYRPRSYQPGTWQWNFSR